MLVLNIGSSGVDVLTVQRRLEDLGDFSGKLNGVYDSALAAAVKQFQARAGLVIDGIVGPITLAHLFPKTKDDEAAYIATLSQFHYRMLLAARSQIGVREHGGQNHGPEVKAYLASVGLEEGEPYCLAGIYWCAQRSATMGGVINPMLRTGHCETFFDWAKSRGYLVKDLSTARPSDIGILLFGHGKGHAFIINHLSLGVWPTVEFNTNIKGSREGDGVMERERRWTEVAGVIRLPEPKEAV